jgi:hypothetical protein
MGIPYRLLTAAAVAVFATAACSGTPSSGLDPDDPGVVHVHGLAIDPEHADVVYAATHTGLFRIHETVAERVGEDFHDLMGFTVADDGTFYASGHPDLQAEHLQREGAPPLLGLVRSTDGGETWEPVSLLGEVDFHALAFVDGRIFGADATSGRLLVSQDGTDWDARSEIGLISVTGRPEGGDVLLVGSGTDRLVVSEDSGRTWDEVTGAGPGWVATDDDGTFLLAGLDGEVLVSADGRTWQRVGELPSRPSAIAADDGTLLAATEEGISRSDDAGGTWETVYRPDR